MCFSLFGLRLRFGGFCFRCLLGGGLLCTQLRADLGLGAAHVLDERAAGGTDERAAAAFDAVHHVPVLGVLEAFVFDLGGEDAWHQLHRACVVAASASQARLGGVLEDLVGREEQDAGGALHDWDVLAIDGHAHHRSAGDELADLASDAAGLLDGLGVGGSHAEAPVAGGDDGGSGDGGHAFVERLAVDDRLGQGVCGAGVHHHAVHVGGQSAAGHLALGDGVDELLFGALWVADLERLHADIRVHARGELGELVDGVALVVLDGDDDVGHAEGVCGDGGADQELVRRLEHQPVVGGQAGFALHAVDDESVDGLAGRDGELHGRREGRAAHADDAGLADALADGLRVGVSPVRNGRERFGGRVLAVRLDDHAWQLGSGGSEAEVKRLDLSGGRRVDVRGDEAGGLADELPALDGVARLHDRRGRRADVHGQRDGVLWQQRRGDNRHAAGDLRLARMDTAVEMENAIDCHSRKNLLSQCVGGADGRQVLGGRVRVVDLGQGDSGVDAHVLGSGLHAFAAADARRLARLHLQEALLGVRAVDVDRCGLGNQPDELLRAGLHTLAAALAQLLVDHGDVVFVDFDGAERTGACAGTQAEAAVGAGLGAARHDHRIAAVVDAVVLRLARRVDVVAGAHHHRHAGFLGLDGRAEARAHGLQGLLLLGGAGARLGLSGGQGSGVAGAAGVAAAAAVGTRQQRDEVVDQRILLFAEELGDQRDGDAGEQSDADDDGEGDKHGIHSYNSLKIK